ncbi:MAG TPA: hypothetical protein VHI30_04660, partial [Gaiellales bacterium]|nr:hypothetical protein [Gaiellales bacterium]
QRYIEDPLADFVLGRALEPGSTVLVDHRDGDEEISLQMIEPVKVPDAPPEDLVPTPADADDAQTNDSGSEPEQPAEPTE